MQSGTFFNINHAENQKKPYRWLKQVVSISIGFPLKYSSKLSYNKNKFYLKQTLSRKFRNLISAFIAV